MACNYTKNSYICKYLHKYLQIYLQAKIMFAVLNKENLRTIGVFSNLKKAVSCMEQMTEINYMPVYRKFKDMNDGEYLDFGDLRMTKLNEGRLYNYDKGKVINEITPLPENFM